jgi:hypothetical protein
MPNIGWFSSGSRVSQNDRAHHLVINVKSAVRYTAFSTFTPRQEPIRNLYRYEHYFIWRIRAAVNSFGVVRGFGDNALFGPPIQRLTAWAYELIGHKCSFHSACLMRSMATA